VVRRFVVAGPDEAARRSGRRRGLAVGAIDETSQVKQGCATAGVQRQYLGCVGKVANGITTVHLAYAREGTGHALIGARQWIPQAQFGDPAKSRVTGLPADLAFRTKGQLAMDICAEAFADWPSAPSPPPCCATAPTPRRHHRHEPIGHPQPTRAWSR
jgi:hypothetical protein